MVNLIVDLHIHMPVGQFNGTWLTVVNAPRRFLGVISAMYTGTFQKGWSISHSIVTNDVIFYMNCRYTTYLPLQKYCICAMYIFTKKMKEIIDEKKEPFIPWYSTAQLTLFSRRKTADITVFRSRTHTRNISIHTCTVWHNWKFSCIWYIFVHRAKHYALLQNTVFCRTYFIYFQCKL